ncbi:hypothetical protein Droror1_Dr00005745 [Drosera rotundifolia]
MTQSAHSNTGPSHLGSVLLISTSGYLLAVAGEVSGDNATSDGDLRQWTLQPHFHSAFCFHNYVTIRTYYKDYQKSIKEAETRWLGDLSPTHGNKVVLRRVSNCDSYSGYIHLCPAILVAVVVQFRVRLGRSPEASLSTDSNSQGAANFLINFVAKFLQPKHCYWYCTPAGGS